MRQFSEVPLRLTLFAVMTIVVLLSACGRSPGPAAVVPPEEPPVPHAGVDPWLRGRITDVSTTEPVTEDCVPAADADGDGTVSSADPPVCDPNPASYGSLAVKGRVAGQDGPMPASVHVGKNVHLEDADGEPLRWADITKGRRVSVWITGEVAESYPVQVRATKIVIE